MTFMLICWAPKNYWEAISSTAKYGWADKENEEEKQDEEEN